MQAKGIKLHHVSWIEPKRTQTELKIANVEVNSSQPHSENESISNIIFKGVVNPAGTVNGTYFQYLVNQSQVEMGVPVKGKHSIISINCHLI